METYHVQSQINEIKANVVKYLLSKTTSDNEDTAFSKTVLHIHQDNPDMVCSIYGFRKGVILFDTPYPGLDFLDINSLNLETLLKVMEQIEYSEKNKLYSRNF